MTERSLMVRTLLPMACDGRGPSATCLNLLPGMISGGTSCSLHFNRHRIPINGVPYRSAIPGPLSFLPYSYVKRGASWISERSYLRSLKDGDIAYFWPSVSLEMHRIAKRRGNPIVLEAINTRMKSAKKILDAAYTEIGLDPQHGITAQRIDEEEEKLELATALFAPNACVEMALADSHLSDGGLIRTSYGASLSHHTPHPRKRPNSNCKVLFVGSACVRKGVHLLLQAWEKASIDGELIIAGQVEPAIAEYCTDQMARSDVRVGGYVSDIRELYREADVFVMPSLEEGGPQVTYEAAAYGLPIIASPMGASRMGEQGDCVVLVDPEDTDAMASALTRLSSSEEERATWGARAKAAVQSYDWPLVGMDRARKLNEMFRA